MALGEGSHGSILNGSFAATHTQRTLPPFAASVRSLPHSRRRLVKPADCGPSLRPARRFRMGKRRSSAVLCTGEAAHLRLPSPHRRRASGAYSVRGASPTPKRAASSFGRLRFRRRDPKLNRSAAITGSSPWLGPCVSLCETSGNSFESFISPLS